MKHRIIVGACAGILLPLAALLMFAPHSLSGRLRHAPDAVTRAAGTVKQRIVPYMRVKCREVGGVLSQLRRQQVRAARARTPVPQAPVAFAGVRGAWSIAVMLSLILVLRLHYRRRRLLPQRREIIHVWV